jgi:hypothetical protein
MYDATGIREVVVCHRCKNEIDRMVPQRDRLACPTNQAHSALHVLAGRSSEHLCRWIKGNDGGGKPHSQRIAEATRAAAQIQNRARCARDPLGDRVHPQLERI